MDGKGKDRIERTDKKRKGNGEKKRKEKGRKERKRGLGFRLLGLKIRI